MRRLLYALIFIAFFPCPVSAQFNPPIGPGSIVPVGPSEGVSGGSTPVIAGINFNFATQTYQGGVTPQAVMPVTNSGGYAKTSAGTLVSFPANTLRITTNGLLIESSSTNYTLQNTAYTNGQWLIQNATTADATGTAPDGTVTASTITDNGTLNAHDILNTTTPTITSGNTYVASVFIKQGTNRYAEITFASMNNVFASTGTNVADAIFDLQAGTVTQTSGVVAASGIEAYANGWYRCWVAATAIATAANNGMIIALQNTGTPPQRLAHYTGSGSTINIWAAQTENNADNRASPSSPVLTTSAPVTRDGDHIVNVSGKLKTLVEASGGQLKVTTFGMPGGVTATIYGQGATGIGLGVTSGNKLTAAGGGTITASTAQTWSGVLTSSYAWNGTGTGLWPVGVGQLPQGQVTAQTAPTTESIGSLGNGTAYLNGYLQSLIVTPANDNTTPAMALAVYNNQTFFTNFAATGLSTIDLGNTHAPGYQWYLIDKFPNSAVTSYQTQTPQDASQITVNGTSGIKITGTTAGPKALVTVADNGAGGLVGTSFANGGYFETYMAFDVTLAPASFGGSDPEFWSRGINFLTNGSATKEVELDFWEPFPTGVGTIQEIMGAHDDGIAGGVFITNNSNTPMPCVSGTPTFNSTTFHRLGGLWITAVANNGLGAFIRFFDGIHVSACDITWSTTTGASPAAMPMNPNGIYSSIDTNGGQWLILASGPVGASPLWPNYVQTVTVLQNFLLKRDLDPASNDNSPVFLNMVG